MFISVFCSKLFSIKITLVLAIFLMLGLTLSTIFISHLEGEAVNSVQGQVINSISRKPVSV